MKASFSYEPVHYSVTLNHLSFTGTSPDLRVANLTGRGGTRATISTWRTSRLQTPDSALTVDGVVRNYLRHTRSQSVGYDARHVSLPEFARVVPALKGYDLHPAFTLKTQRALDTLRVSLDWPIRGGRDRGHLTTDVQSPEFAAQGDVSS